ncbi:MAG: single-stranded DNA-binding protein [Candidatus Margulisiibacteriota bacterium]|nr:single-stranded DNA-binding protein [Candidatus Margulisiibacteriota bacterium]
MLARSERQAVANLNRIILVGRLTSDPDARSTMDGLPMTKFRVAVARPSFGKQSETDFVDIVAWRKVAEECSDNLKKGAMALIEGRIQNRSFDDQTGKRRWVTEVVARSVVMLGKSAPSSTEELVDNESLASDLPF